MSPEVIGELAPSGVLRAGINTANFLLVSGRDDLGDPEGISPDLARAIADRLGVQVRYMCFADPGDLAEAAGKDVWDIALIGSEPQRAEKIAFSPSYVEIEASYLVPTGSPLQAVGEVDAAGNRIVSTRRTAYHLWLERNIKHAELVGVAGANEAFERFVAEGLEALAGLKPRLLSDIEKLPGARILSGRFTSIQQAVGTDRANVNGAAFIRAFIEEMNASGFVRHLIEKHKVEGLSLPLRP